MSLDIRCACLDRDIYNMYKESYPNSDYDNVWDAMFKTSRLFSRVAKDVAKHFGYEYIIDDEKNMIEYIKRIKDKYDSKFL